jgi:2-amino-4-hydroxy-6-hydroxymethyldihydropteridine diphosphokinase
MPNALLGLGGNVGDVRATLARAVAMFADGKDVKLRYASSHYRTPPWGVLNQPRFINMAISVDTELAPRELLQRAMNVEASFGRDIKDALAQLDDRGIERLPALPTT